MLRPKRRILHALAAASAALALGCGSPPTAVRAEWKDATVGARSWRGAVVYVACDAGETALKQHCEDELEDLLQSLGTTVRRGGPENDRPVPLLDRIAAAKAAGASAVLVVKLVPAVARVDSGVSIGLGIGGFGRHVGGGIGISAPIGGGTVATGYAADAQLTEAGEGRLAWTAALSAQPASDPAIQVERLAQAVVDAGSRAGVL